MSEAAQRNVESPSVEAAGQLHQYGYAAGPQVVFEHLLPRIADPVGEFGICDRLPAVPQRDLVRGTVRVPENVFDNHMATRNAGVVTRPTVLANCHFFTISP